MARKDDPVFNVKFVQLVENQACLWNYTHPGYSKKEEVQRAWQHVANEIKDTVRNSRERWRTIRSSFLRSLKLARTQTGRGKRKYYLSKYLQFLIPYTKSRACHKQLLPAGAQAASVPVHAQPNGGMVLRKPSTSTAATAYLAGSALPMTRIGQMRVLASAEENTKDSNDSDTQPLDVRVSEEEDDDTQGAAAVTPLRLQAIKVEQQHHPLQQHSKELMLAAAAQHSLESLPATMVAALRNNMDWTEWFKSGGGNNNNSCNQLQFQQQQQAHGNMLALHGHGAGVVNTPPPAASTPAPTAVSLAGLSTGNPLDADYSFLISLHPYLKEMSGKQNRRFRQKVVGLIDNVLDNVDV